MEIKKGVIVALGYGKYFVSDKIVGFIPIEEDRGPARRTFVYVDGLSEPVVASHTETAMLNQMVEQGPVEFQGAMAVELVGRLLHELEHVGPMLRRSIKEECGLDLDEIERKSREILSGGQSGEYQEGLFSLFEEE
ncbi:MAG: hypothetical protein JXA49_08980 [Actinobacteria bacterium]|nr:hypothetical protein [Actinomycetota bacterium]